ncbi:MAG: nucleoside kinase [Bacillota bacterium]|nr:nucleoside kinase [Bacillota bacterium]
MNKGVNEEKMAAQINISFADGGQMSAKRGTRLQQLLELVEQPPLTPIAAIVNGDMQELDYPLFADSTVEWIDYNSDVGWRIYRRSLLFVLLNACLELFPERRLWVSHSLGEGVFCMLEDDNASQPTAAEILALKEQMRRYVAEGRAIGRVDITRDDAIAFFRGEGKPDKAELLARRDDGYVSLYSFEGGCSEYFFGRMAGSARCLHDFDLIPFEQGMVLQLPAREYLGCVDNQHYRPQQLQTVLHETHEWSELLGVRTVADLNRLIQNGDFTELVLIAETLQERALHRIVDDIYANFPQVRLLLLAGPSSSGKTTTTQRLKIQFRTIGIRPLTISMDDYFLDRAATPLNERGKKDYETLRALDLPRFNSDLLRLLGGEEVRLPHYDFISGVRGGESEPVRLEDDQIIIVEGIHALNEELSQRIDKRRKRKMFVSALTQLNFDAYSPLSAADNRLIRRLVRDVRTRDLPAASTLEHWNEVRRGEHINIFPFQEQADYFFNSSLIYELPVLRPLFETQLQSIDAASPCYLEAKRLLRCIRYFEPAPADVVPRNSVLQEFLGNSIFSVG